MLQRASRAAALALILASMIGSTAVAGRSGMKSLSGTTPSHPGNWTSARESLYTNPPFTQVVYNEPITGLAEESVELTGIAAGIYNSYRVTLDWGTSVNEAWSSEALWALSDSPTIAGASVFYADPGSSLDSADNPTPVSLSWTGYFDTPYTAPANGSLYFLMAQEFNDSGATWSNISISLGDALVQPPVAVQAYLGGSTSAPVSAAQVLWYVFDYDGTSEINLDTAGSTLTVNSFGAINDTELAIYDAAGMLIETNDDTNFTAGILTSSLSFGVGDLPAGRYYVAASGFNGTFANAFGAVSTSISTGTIVLSGLHIPEPASIALIGFAGATARRRR